MHGNGTSSGASVWRLQLEAADDEALIRCAVRSDVMMPWEAAAADHVRLEVQCKRHQNGVKKRREDEEEEKKENCGVN